MRGRRVIDVQRRLQELGRIRLGDKKGTKGSQRKLEKFRLTSQSRPILESAAAIYGGEVVPWEDGGFELYTDADRLDIAIPPAQEPYSQAYELWSGGGCQRRCDGENAIVRQRNGDRERACVCDADNRECKLYTRVSFMLPRVQGLGVWRLETKGYNAGVELTAALDLFAAVLSGGGFLPGAIRLEQRTKKVPGEATRRFVVPVIELEATVGELLGGQAVLPTLAPVLEAVVRGRPQLSPGPPPPEGGTRVGPADDEPVAPAPSWGDSPELPEDPPTVPEDDEIVVEAEPVEETPAKVISRDQLRRLWTITRSAGMPEETLRPILAAHHHDKDDPSSKTLRVDAYERVVEAVEAWAAANPQPEETK